MPPDLNNPAFRNSAPRHSEPSQVLSLDDDSAAQGTPGLIRLALEAARRALEIDLSDISGRLSTPPYYPNIWPGEHYRFLAGLLETLKPKTVVEIGTGSGLSALTMLKYLPEDGRLVTFDITDWRKMPSTVLWDADFADGRLHASTDDLTDTLLMAVYHGLLSETDLFFIDASKDGVMERKLIVNLETIPFRKPPILVFDDIRLMNMIPIWRSLKYPKLDVTSFGHWSGTGLVHFAPDQKIV